MYTDRWLYLDDVRTPVSDKFDVVRNFKDFQDYIRCYGIPAFISFDHDLADEHMVDYIDQTSKFGFQTPSYEQYKEKTGLECARWLCEEFILKENPELILKNCGVHSHNPIGGENIRGYINSFKKHMGWEPNCFLGRHAFTMNPNISTNGLNE